MRWLSKLYLKVMSWARHKHAPIYLGCVSFTEASCFIVPPDVLLAPMALAKPERAWHYSLLTTLTSVAGALLGYVLGCYFFILIKPMIVAGGYYPMYSQIMTQFNSWGVWIILLAGFMPIPYKLFTIAAGAFGLPLLQFVIASLIGRGMRFSLVAGLMRYGGERLEARIMAWIDRFSLYFVGAVLLLLFFYGIYKYL